MTRREEIDVPGQAAPISHYAHAVRADGPLLFVSGIVPVDERGDLVGGDDVAEQVEGAVGHVDDAHEAEDEGEAARDDEERARERQRVQHDP